MSRAVPYVDNLKPQLKWYGISVLFALTGVVIIIFYSITKFEDFFSALAQIKVPGAEDVTLVKKGAYLIFHEYSTEYEGKSYTGKPGLDRLVFSITGKKSGKQITLKPSKAGHNFDLFGRKGVAIYFFEIEQAGIYTISATEKTKNSGAPAIISISNQLPGYVLSSIVTDDLLIILLTLFLASTSWATVFIMRYRYKEKMTKAGKI